MYKIQRLGFGDRKWISSLKDLSSLLNAKGALLNGLQDICEQLGSRNDWKLLFYKMSLCYLQVSQDFHSFPSSLSIWVRPRRGPQRMETEHHRRDFLTQLLLSRLPGAGVGHPDWIIHRRQPGVCWVVCCPVRETDRFPAKGPWVGSPAPPLCSTEQGTLSLSPTHYL